MQLRREDDFTDSDIDDLQDKMDEFCELYIKMFGRDHVTNYIHMLAAGHFRYYYRIYRNLHRHANHGWEALNGVLKNFMLRRTQHGGHGGAHRNIVPLAQSMMSMAVRRGIYLLDGDTNELVHKCIEEGKQIKKAQRVMDEAAVEVDNAAGEEEELLIEEEVGNSNAIGVSAVTPKQHTNGQRPK
jgi:hypothetical protein